jgi:hypothetical protein
MRVGFAAVAAAFALIACSPSPTQAQSGDGGKPQAADADAAQTGGGQTESQTAYIARCRQETIAANPNARAQADSICQSKWGEVVAAGPMADALLTVAPAPGTAFAPATAQARIGRLQGGIAVEVTRTPGVTLSWFADGAPIPFNLEDALRVRGARLAMIGCLSYGYSEGTRVYRVEAPGKAAFALTIAFMNAAVASQSSTYSAAADFSGRMPTVAVLSRDGSEWTPTCPQ